MIGQKLKSTLRKGLPSALLEIALIFVGITLAIAFENWNTERSEREEELALLADLRSNLEENLVILEEMTEFNKQTIASLETVLEYIETKRPYSESLASHLGIIDNWSSPHLTSSAYQTLKSRGLEIISDSELRHQIVRLFDVDYVYLADDYDRSEWINYELSTVPMMLRHLEEDSSLTAIPVDYDALLEDHQFRIAIRRTLSLRNHGISRLAQSSESTTQVLSAIATATDL
jgi:hypothetical protein